MNTLSELVTSFYSKDPIRGEDASFELLKNWRDDAIEALIPLNDDVYPYSYQVQLRLKYVASILGNQIVPHLVKVISAGPWHSKRAAAICFSGIKDSDETAAALIEILKDQPHFDAERMAIESLGRLGASRVAYELERYARCGKWSSRSDRFQEYPFEKLSSFVLEAFTRLTSLESDPETADTMFRDLTTLIELRESKLGRRIPNSYDIVENLSNEFVEWSVDPIIKHWGRSSNPDLQRLAVDLFRNVAPLSATDFLLETAIDPAKSASVRRGASIALGELRVPEVAQRLATVLRDPAVDRTYLDWAFSTLYAVVPAEWWGLSGYIDELLKHDNDQALQLRYSLALKGDDRCRKDLIRCLDDADPFVRWTSALALARLLGPEAQPYLEQRAGNVAPDERCAMYAAMIRAGDHEKVAALHEALQEVDLSGLFSVWKLEIIDAFRWFSAPGERVVSLWRDATQIGTRQLQYSEALEARATDALIESILEPAPIPRARNRTKIFVSYSHADQRWLYRLQVHLKPLQQSNKITLWDDTMIKSGEKWREVIRRALDETKVAVLLISADFLASDFINTVELPALLEAAASEGVLIIPVLVSPSRFELTESLVQFQSPNLPKQPLNALRKAKQEEVFVKVSEVVEQAFRS
ncbi:MAG TPA: HEAT repeat domain-containing protein [Pyrinomonadaceae bacterium]|nr:HEAT repeat domain-containing protein [Pyrinomonadaceae bacterium]